MAIPVHSLLNLNHKFNLSYLFHNQIKCISSFGKIAFSHIQDVAAPVLNCVQSHIILDHSITSPQAKDHIIPLGGQTLLYANKNYQYANKQFQSYLSKTEQDEELQFRVTAKQYLQSCCVFQCSWFLQGHSQSWAVAMVRRDCGCTVLGPAGSLGATVITCLIKDKTAVQQLWEKTMRKKAMREKSLQTPRSGKKWRRRTGCNSLSPYHGVLSGEGGRKTSEKWVNLGLGKREVGVRGLQFWFYFSLFFYFINS